MISFSSSKSVLSYLGAQTAEAVSLGEGSTPVANLSGSAMATARAAATAQAALQAAGSTHKALVAGRDLDKVQTTLAGDMRTVMSRAGVKLSGAVEFSVSSDGRVDLKGTDADKSAVSAS